jgi:ABC-type polysaccharide/polyol phosphate transport system ATPase subunit
MDEIIRFSELENVIDDPLRTYSSGMRMRLGFSVVAHTDPDLLLIDEVLAVGDLKFQHKCMERIRQFKANQCTILLVSHSLGQVQEVSDKVLWLDRGRRMLYGNVDEVLAAYEGRATQEM